MSKKERREVVGPRPLPPNQGKKEQGTKNRISDLSGAFGNFFEVLKKLAEISLWPRSGRPPRGGVVTGWFSKKKVTDWFFEEWK